MNRRKRMLQKRKRKQLAAEPNVLMFREGTAYVKGNWIRGFHDKPNGTTPPEPEPKHYAEQP